MEIPEIGVDELERHLAGGAPLVDVREEHEYETIHIEGARSIPLGMVTDSVDRFATDTTTYVICAMGSRSARAVEFLRGHGLDAVNVAGGMRAWIDTARPTVAGPEPTA